MGEKDEIIKRRAELLSKINIAIKNGDYKSTYTELKKIKREIEAVEFSNRSYAENDQLREVNDLLTQLKESTPPGKRRVKLGKVRYRNGQVLGEEKYYCSYCDKETDHKVVYFPAKKSTWVLAGALSYALLGDAHVAYICSKCNHYTRPENQKEIKSKYGWSNWTGFRGIPNDKIEFKLEEN
ncbi:MAG: hypothetical protein QXL94_08480 [Candidatus Parvarchaeum sp.]